MSPSSRIGSEAPPSPQTSEAIAAEVRRLGPWFHNLDLRGVRTAPDHFLGGYPFSERRIFELPGYPRLSFVERSYSGDPTNWWVPNLACLAAMIRSAGFRITAHPEAEVFVCEPVAPGGEGT